MFSIQTYFASMLFQGERDPLSTFGAYCWWNVGIEGSAVRHVLFLHDISFLLPCLLRHLSLAACWMLQPIGQIHKIFMQVKPARSFFPNPNN